MRVVAALSIWFFGQCTAAMIAAVLCYYRCLPVTNATAVNKFCSLKVSLILVFIALSSCGPGFEQHALHRRSYALDSLRLARNLEQSHTSVWPFVLARPFSQALLGRGRYKTRVQPLRR